MSGMLHFEGFKWRKHCLILNFLSLSSHSQSTALLQIELATAKMAATVHTAPADTVHSEWVMLVMIQGESVWSRVSQDTLPDPARDCGQHWSLWIDTDTGDWTWYWAGTHPQTSTHMVSLSPHTSPSRHCHQIRNWFLISKELKY